MVADYYPEERRGAKFAALYMTGALGALLGASDLFVVTGLPVPLSTITNLA